MLYTWPRCRQTCSSRPRLLEPDPQTCVCVLCRLFVREFFGATSSTRRGGCCGLLWFGEHKMLLATIHNTARPSWWRHEASHLFGRRRWWMRSSSSSSRGGCVGRQWWRLLWRRRRRQRKPIQIFKSGTCLLTVTVIVYFGAATDGSGEVFANSRVSRRLRYSKAKSVAQLD